MVGSGGHLHLRLTLAAGSWIGPGKADLLEGIAETKGAIYQALPPDGIAVINAEVTDVLRATALRLEAQSGPPYAGVVGFSEDLRKKVDEARDFLSENLYQHPRVLRANSRCYRIIEASEGVPLP